MPIANCLLHNVPDELESQLDSLTALWSQESGISTKQMTINLMTSTRQIGTAYRVMAFLYLPSLWDAEQVRQLQVGLARAFSRALAMTPDDVHVITSIVDSGHVVEGGKPQTW